MAAPQSKTPPGFSVRTVAGGRNVHAHLVRRLGSRVAIDSDQEMAAVGYLDGVVLVLGHDGLRRTISVGSDVADVALLRCRGEPLLAVASLDTVRILDNDGGTRSLLRGHEGRATGVVWFGGDPGLMVSSDERGHVYRWPGDTVESSGSIGARTRVHRKAIHALVASRWPDGRDVFITASDDREVIVHDARRDDVLRRFSAHAGWVEQVIALERRGVLDALAVIDRVGLTVWDVATGAPRTRVHVHAATSLAAPWGVPHRDHVAVGGSHGEAVSWAGGRARRVTHPRGGEVKAVAFLGNGARRPRLCLVDGGRVWTEDGGGSFGEIDAGLPSPIVGCEPWPNSDGLLLITADGALVKLCPEEAPRD